MKVLALELSSGRGSITLRDGEREIFSEEFANDRKHSGWFFATLQRCLTIHGNPERLVVGLGPGSYAGTRIAIAAAIGLQTATGAELLGLPSVCAFPAEVSEYVVVGDARRQSFFFAHICQRRCVDGPELCSAEELSERLRVFTGPVFATERLALVPDATLAFPSARLLASLPVEDATPPPLEPIYLREPHITQPRVAKIG